MSSTSPKVGIFRGLFQQAHQMAPPVDIGFIEDTADMALYSFFGDKQLCRNFLVAQPCRHQLRYLPFPFGKIGHLLRVLLQHGENPALLRLGIVNLQVLDFLDRLPAVLFIEGSRNKIDRYLRKQARNV